MLRMKQTLPSAMPLTITPQLPLLIDAEMEYQSDLTMKMEPGDRIVAYTDGAIEATNAAGEFLETSGLQGMLCRHADADPKPPERFVRNVVHELRQYASNGLKDDLAIVCLQHV
jgi:serine phosphatase RsbU (regulator of sigma subunit)